MQLPNLKANNINFNGIIVPSEIVRAKILYGLNDKQLNLLKSDLMKQTSNPIDAYISSEKNRLKAKLFCTYRLKDFKENYKQIPFFESNLAFIKRVIKICDKYKKQLSL